MFPEREGGQEIQISTVVKLRYHHCPVSGMGRGLPGYNIITPVLSLRVWIPIFIFYFFFSCACFQLSCSFRQTSATEKGYHIAHNIIYLCIKSGPVSQIHKKDWTLFFLSCHIIPIFQWILHTLFSIRFSFAMAIIIPPHPPPFQPSSISFSLHFIFLSSTRCCYTLGLAKLFAFDTKTTNTFFSVRIVDKTFSFQIRMEKGFLLNVCPESEQNYSYNNSNNNKKNIEENNRKKNINR